MKEDLQVFGISVAFALLFGGVVVWMRHAGEMVPAVLAVAAAAVFVWPAVRAISSIAEHDLRVAKAAFLLLILGVSGFLLL